jgi:hypothetical protein
MNEDIKGGFIGLLYGLQHLQTADKIALITMNDLLRFYTRDHLLMMPPAFDWAKTNSDYNFKGIDDDFTSQFSNEEVVAYIEKVTVLLAAFEWPVYEVIDAKEIGEVFVCGLRQIAANYKLKPKDQLVKDGDPTIYEVISYGMSTGKKEGSDVNLVSIGIESGESKITSGMKLHLHRYLG